MAREKLEVNSTWNKLLSQRQAAIDYLGTFQGRYPSQGRDSTNGCAVISPLIGYRHVSWKQPKLPTAHINHVIDVDCPPILQSIRSKLGLPKGSFIVPADVHDYLFDAGLLKDLFGDVHGGNVLDDEHLNNLTMSLEKLPRGHKAAVAFFFSEHVNAILKNADGTYEFVDSLPHRPAGVGVRILCSSVAVLKICMKWYCLNKFSSSKEQYIEKNAWSEMTAEIDPRTFQAHVWHKKLS